MNYNLSATGYYAFFICEEQMRDNFVGWYLRCKFSTPRRDDAEIKPEHQEYK